MLLVAYSAACRCPTRCVKIAINKICFANLCTALHQNAPYSAGYVNRTLKNIVPQSQKNCKIKKEEILTKSKLYIFGSGIFGDKPLINSYIQGNNVNIQRHICCRDYILIVLKVFSHDFIKLVADTADISEIYHIIIYKTILFSPSAQGISNLDHPYVDLYRHFFEVKKKMIEITVITRAKRLSFVTPCN